MIRKRMVSSGGFTAFVALLVVSAISSVRPARADDIDKLKNSTWDTKYKGDGIDGSIKAYVYFTGKSGKYRALDDDGSVILKGTFSKVKYKEKKSTYVISGDWEAAGLSGTFEFEIDEDDLNSFEGTWETDDGRREGTWRGSRKPVPLIP